ncbi:MAG: hypothetical protein IKH20_00715 [Clostridiales bacterium]|nr:hypothetical protein [Clostridiales bacterium]
MDNIRETWLYKFGELLVLIATIIQFILTIVSWFIKDFPHTIVLSCLVIIQGCFIFVLIGFTYNYKCQLSFIKALENNERVNLTSAIQMFLNKDLYANTVRIDKATVDISVVNYRSEYSNNNEDCDMRFEWRFEGKNTNKKNLDRFFFRLFTASSTSYSKLAFSANQVINYGGGTTQKTNMKTDDDHICDKSNMIIIPLLFDKPIGKNESFIVETSYTCHSFFMQKKDWLTFAPYNFSKIPLEKLEINIHCDDEIITKEKYYIRLYKMLIKSIRRRDLDGASRFNYLPNGVFSSGVIEVNPKYIYTTEIVRN